MTDQKRSLRLAAMPSGMPATKQYVTAVNRIASEVIASFHCPIAAIRRNDRPQNAPCRAPAVRQPTTTRNWMIAQNGTQCRKSVKAVSTCWIGHRIA